MTVSSVFTRITQNGKHLSRLEILPPPEFISSGTAALELASELALALGDGEAGL